MIPVYVPCPACRGDGHVLGVDAAFPSCPLVVRCLRCDGLGRQWAPGAPAFGCTVTLADREPGEIVTLGNGQRAKVLWHLPYKRENGDPHTTFIDILDASDFFERETHIPVGYPSCVGVASVDEARARIAAKDSKHTEDASDPMQRHRGALL